MSGSIFDRTPPVSTRRRAPFGTIAISVLLHTMALAVIVGVQLTSAALVPGVRTPLQAFVAPDPVLPEVPPPAPPPRAPVPAVVDVNPAAAPTSSPDTITEERLLPAGPPTSSIAVGPPGLTGLPGSGIDPRIMAPPPPPAPQSREPLPVGGAIQAPRRVSATPPVYPTLAKAARVEGDVVIDATIDETGRVVGLRVRQSVPLLDKAALEAVSSWRYEPTRLNGRAVAVIMLVTVRFRLQ